VLLPYLAMKRFTQGLYMTEMEQASPLFVVGGF